MPAHPDALELRLRAREPAVRLVSELTILRVLARTLDAGDRVPHNPWLPLWVPADRIADLAIDHSLPRLLLITAPDDRLLHGCTETEVNAVYDRLLDRTFFFAQLGANGIDYAGRFQTLPESCRREIRFVLASDRLLPDDATDAEVARTFLAVLAELRTNRTESIPDVFPLLAPERIDPLLAEWVGPVSPVAAPQPVAPEQWDRPDIGEIVGRTRNHVRMAIDYHRRQEDRATAVGILCLGLGGRLRDTLHLDGEKVDRWNAALAAVLPHTSTATWTPAAKALYELQKMALDLVNPMFAVAPFEWLRSYGERPVKQPLDKAVEIIRLRHLAKAARHLNRVPLSDTLRRIWNELLEHEMQTAEDRIRHLIAPILRDALDRAGLVAVSRVEGIAREKLVAELIRTICDRGFFRLSDLRDAIARNGIKLHDLDGLREIATGDELLRADKILAAELFGIYQRGEVYLRGIQRLSAIGFGTLPGRTIALVLLLPFGGAFLALEFLQHLLHGAWGLAQMLGPAAESHPPHLVDWWTLLPLGGFLLGLLHSPRFRSAVGSAFGRIGTALAQVFVVLPNALWNSRPVRAIRNNPLARYLWRTVALPLALGTIAALASILYSDIFSPAVTVAVGVLVFAASLIAIHSKPGLLVYDTFAEAALDTGRFVWASLIPGLVSWFVWVFREIADAVERLLYAVDEWFRFREGQSREMIGLKVALAVFWFPIAYVVRFVFYLLVEPQVNPVKHFPVVTVSHKIIWPMVPQLARWTGLSPWTMGTIVNGIPGIFGFMAWELKENWRLYAANRAERLQPVAIGHHGETMRGLLRPGFHSGTVPKLFHKLRVLLDAPAPDSMKRQRLHDELHHLADALRRQVQWELLPLLGEPAVFVRDVTIGCLRIEVDLARRESDSRLTLAWELHEGKIVGSRTEHGWAVTADEAAAFSGLDAFAAVRHPEPPAWTDWVKRWEPRS